MFDGSSETVHRVPRSHWDCHLSTFRWDWIEDGDAVRGEVDGFLDRWRDGGAPHLLLLGERGLGKTHLAVGLYRAAVWETDLVRAAMIHMPTFCDDVKRSFDDPDADPFVDVRRADMLVVDDLFGRRLTDWELSQVVPRVIDEAYRRRAAMVVTANTDLDDLRGALAEHEVSRLLEDASAVYLAGTDRRLAKGEDG